MSINDGDLGEYAPRLEDEEIFDAHAPPGYEIGKLDIRADQGSGSYAEDGRLEVAEDTVMENGEAQIGSAAMYGPTEIGSGLYPVDGASEIGSGLYPVDGASEIGSGLYPVDGASEIGSDPASVDDANDDSKDNPADFDADDDYAPVEESEIGSGPYAMSGASEIGHGLYPVDGASEIGSAAMYGPTEIGQAAELMSPFETFMLDDTRIGTLYPTHGASEIGYGPFATHGASEIGAGWAAREGETEIGLVAVIEKARDNRQPPPPMDAVPVDAPLEDDGWSLADVFIGAAEATGVDAFPLTSQLLQRAGAAIEPRYVRIDTEESYKQFRQENSPELAALKAKIDEHISDPHAHERLRGSEDDEEDFDAADLSDDIDDLVLLGEEVQAAEEQKRVELFMPVRFDGLLTAWREGDDVCASLTLPGKDGELRICTSLEPISKCVSEMSRHAAEANVSVGSVVRHLPAMGCALGAGTIIKEIAAAAPAIVAKTSSAPAPMVVRIEPKMSPNIAALCMLVQACREGNAQACDEWKRLGDLSAPVVRDAMNEALQLVKAIKE